MRGWPIPLEAWAYDLPSVARRPTHPVLSPAHKDYNLARQCQHDLHTGDEFAAPWIVRFNPIARFNQWFRLRVSKILVSQGRVISCGSAQQDTMLWTKKSPWQQGLDLKRIVSWGSQDNRITGWRQELAALSLQVKSFLLI